LKGILSKKIHLKLWKLFQIFQNSFIRQKYARKINLILFKKYPIVYALKHQYIYIYILIKHVYMILNFTFNNSYKIKKKLNWNIFKN